jgi:hypothetical protein
MDKTLRKITTRIWHTALDSFEERMEEQCLRRDSYLNRVLEIELDQLDAEVSIANSADAEAFVTDRLKQVDKKMISLAIRSDLADRLDAICSAKRIVRDAFFNRLFLMLAARPALIDRLFFSAVADEWKRELLKEDKSAWMEYFSNAFYPLAQGIDPFMGIREALQMYSQSMGISDLRLPDGRVVKVHSWAPAQVEAKLGVYTAFFDKIGPKGPELYGFNTYVPDWRIPDHPSELATRVSLDDLI